MADIKNPSQTYPTFRGPGGGDSTRGPMPGPTPTPGVAPEPEGSKLIVGRNIRLRGEIEACDTLVVEGNVEASMSSRIIEIAEGGIFKGKVDIDSAHIRGRFEGELTARERLTIYSTGKVSGEIQYGQIQVEVGGELAGATKVWTKDQTSRAPKPEASPAAPVDNLRVAAAAKP